MILKKHLKEIKKGFRGIVGEGKDRVYRTISFIEQRVESGDFIGEIKGIAKEISEKGKEMHNNPLLFE